MSELDRMRTFVRVVERGSLAGVVRETGMGQSTVSRHLKELEADLGVTLLQRTTRRLRPTEIGALYYERAKTILALIEQARDEVRGSKASPEGLVRVTGPSAFSILHLSRIIFAFQDAHPDVQVDLRVTDERVDLIKEGVDFAVRLGPLADSTLRARQIGRAKRVMVASPAYLARHGEPRRPEDLDRHNVVRFAGLGGSDVVQFHHPRRPPQAVAVRGDFLADQGLAIREAFLAGRGLGPAHIWLVADLIEAGRLQTILTDYSLAPVPLSLIITPGRGEVARVRLLIDFICREIKKTPGFAD